MYSHYILPYVPSAYCTYFSVHKRKINNFKRRNVVVPTIFHTVMADLIDYKKYMWHNRRYRYVLVVIDAFSRFAWTRALKTKTAVESAEALDSIFSEMPYKPRFFASDQGNEFTISNEVLHKILIEKYRMKVYTLKGKTKSSIVERWNRTFKTRMQRYFSEKKKYVWTSVLQDFTRNINNSINRSIGMAPADVDFNNADSVRKTLYPLMRNPKPCRYKPGDVVRIVVEKTLFQKGYEQSKFFTISLHSKKHFFKIGLPRFILWTVLAGLHIKLIFHASS